MSIFLAKYPQTHGMEDKMGWIPGQGLGKFEQGINKPIKAVNKRRFDRSDTVKASSNKKRRITISYIQWKKSAEEKNRIYKLTYFQR